VRRPRGKNPECVCGHGQTVHRHDDGYCLRLDCVCFGFEEAVLRQLGDKWMSVKKQPQPRMLKGAE
jgi:hypothetical protein